MDLSMHVYEWGYSTLAEEIPLCILVLQLFLVPLFHVAHPKDFFDI